MNNINIIDSQNLYRMLRLGFTSLSFNENYLNEINTFPVSDSDTGTNMKRTFQKGLVSLNQTNSAGELLLSFAKNMSLESRGNSGFIFSQYFLGLAEYLKDKETITIEDFSNGLMYAYKVAYAAVINPMEGTMLTVMLEGANEVLKYISSIKDYSFVNLFDVFSQSVFDGVLKTQSQMSLLDSNYVVDSGALGFYLVIDGMRKIFNESPYFNCEESTLLPKRISDVDNPLTFFRYCTEFTISLKETHSKKFFSNILTHFGDSVVVAINGNNLKVHVHTNVPQKIINDFKRFGTLLFTKIDDLFSTPEFDRMKRRKHEGYGVVAFTYGDDNALLYERLGVDVCFPLPHGHETSDEEIKTLLSCYLNDKLIIFSADKKIEEKIKSIAWWDGRKDVLVVECSSLTNTFFKLASSMFDVTFDEFKQQINLLKKIKNFEYKIINNENIKSQLKEISKVIKSKKYSTVAVFGGKNVTKEDINMITSFFAMDENIEFNYFSGGQEDSLFTLGAM